MYQLLQNHSTHTHTHAFVIYAQHEEYTEAQKK